MPPIGRPPMRIGMRSMVNHPCANVVMYDPFDTNVVMDCDGWDRIGTFI